MNNETEVTCIKCDKCGDIIYSRAVHDFHYCGCGEIYIDGGLDYTRFGSIGEMPKQFKLNVDADRATLYDDWGYRKNKYGIIKGGK